MGRTKTKVCTISGNKYPANSKNFYVNHNAADSLHPYHKGFDASVEQVRKLVDLMNS
jgi:hypothetical protein